MAELTDKKESFFQRPKKNRIEDQDIESAIKQDQRAAFARYRELVKARREKEKLSPREPEVYHHDICKKS
jgi:ATP/maltotriose-dependent transcriptional regulator MalT